MLGIQENTQTRRVWFRKLCSGINSKGGTFHKNNTGEVAEQNGALLHASKG